MFDRVSKSEMFRLQGEDGRRPFVRLFQKPLSKDKGNKLVFIPFFIYSYSFRHFFVTALRVRSLLGRASWIPVPLA